MPRKRKPTHQIIPCQSNPRMRAVWWVPRVMRSNDPGNHGMSLRTGGNVVLQLFYGGGWQDCLLVGAFVTAMDAMTALARAYAMFENPELKDHLASIMAKEKEPSL